MPINVSTRRARESKRDHRAGGNRLRGVGRCLFCDAGHHPQYVALGVPALMVQCARYVIQALLSTAILLPLHGRALLRTAQPRLQLLRGLLLICTTTMAFFSLRFMPVGELTAIVMATPMVVTVLLVTVFEQRIAPLQWLFVFGGFAGTLMIARRGGGDLGWVVQSSLGCMVFSSLFQSLISHLGKSENPATIHFYSVWVGAILSTLGLPFAWTMFDSPLLWLLTVFMGLMGALGHFVLALTSVLTPYLYCHVGFAVLGGWLVFSHRPDGWAWLGIGLIALSSICSARCTARERRLPVLLPKS